jgi:pimeloyl-ACP methyl ester carboxylesterase
MPHDPDSREPAPSWGDFGVLTVDRLSSTVEGMHGAIMRPWLRLAGGRFAGLTSSATSAVYGSVRMVARGAGRVSNLVLEGMGTGSTPRSDAVQAFANAVWGDEFERRGSSMSIAMTVRSPDGAAVSPDPRSVERAFGSPAGRLVVMLHGLGQTERCFGPSETNPGLAHALASHELTPVLVRYNTGRAVATNGAELSSLLDELVGAWPAPVTEIALVGYSMGGLVARAAIDAALADRDRWVDTVRTVVTIAAPHAGSPIEKTAEAASRSLGVAPQTRSLGDFVRSRSAGIRDLRSGVDLPPSFDGVEHHVIAAVVTDRISSPVGSLVGDLVVRPVSALGRAGLRVDGQAIIGGRRHFDILEDPSTAEHILGWIDPGRRPPTS